MQSCVNEARTTQDCVLLTNGIRRRHNSILKLLGFFWFLVGFFFFFFHLIEPDFDNQDCLGRCCNASSDITLYGYISLYNDTTLSRSVTGL